MSASESPARRRVLFLPGFGAGDGSTAVLRTTIAAYGHRVHRWRAGRNTGPTPELIESLEARLREIAARPRPNPGHHGPASSVTKVTIVGWSLGGVYGWLLAGRSPELVDQLITLGSPLRRGRLAMTPLPMPVTSIWSKQDRVVPWKSSLVSGDRTENIEVHGTHITLGFDPLVSHAIADRLSQDPAAWQPFQPPRWPGAYPTQRRAS
ncbi:MAG: esterase/lipase family protein [Acidimicrobiales bacterium]